MDGLFDFLAKENKPMMSSALRFRDEMDAPGGRGPGMPSPGPDGNVPKANTSVHP